MDGKNGLKAENYKIPRRSGIENVCQVNDAHAVGNAWSWIVMPVRFIKRNYELLYERNCELIYFNNLQLKKK